MQHDTARELFNTLSAWLSETSINLFDVSKRSGVAYNTVRAIRDGEGNPTMNTLDNIYKTLTSNRDDVSCSDCGHCAEWDTVEGVYGCELRGVAHEMPSACGMFEVIAHD